MFFPIRDLTAFLTVIMFVSLVAFLGDWAVVSGY